MPDNDHNEFRSRVLDEVRSLRKDVKDLYEIMVKVQVEIAMLKVKSSLWGGAAGLLAVLTVLGIDFLSRNSK